MKRTIAGRATASDRDTSALNRRQVALLERVAAMYLEASYAPPSITASAQALNVPPHAIAGMLEIGEVRGVFVRVAERLWFHADVVMRAQDLVREIAARDSAVSVGAFRDATGSSRKYVVPLLEHFDATGLTCRDGDLRTLVEVVGE
jgi:selenocysteine-specific elongation factor